MRTKQSIICLLLIIGLVGCKNKIWYNVVTRNHSDQKFYAGKIEEFEKYIPSWSATYPGAGGNAGPLRFPVPDKITILWKSIKPGKEKAVELHEKKIDAIGGGFLPEDRSDLPKYTRFPSDLYVDHKVVLILKGKVPKKPEDGDIVITYMGDENFDVKWEPGKLSKR